MYRSWVSLTLMLALAHPLLSQTAPSLTPESLKAALKAKPSGTQAEQLAEHPSKWFRKQCGVRRGALRSTCEMSAMGLRPFLWAL
jgi:hypothetical protein